MLLTMGVFAIEAQSAAVGRTRSDARRRVVEDAETRPDQESIAQLVGQSGTRSEVVVICILVTARQVIAPGENKSAAQGR